MSDERRKRSRFDQTEPEPLRKSRFDRRSRSPTREGQDSSHRSRSPVQESAKPDDTKDPAAIAAAAAARINEALKAKREPQGGGSGTPVRNVSGTYLSMLPK